MAKELQLWFASCIATNDEGQVMHCLWPIDAISREEAIGFAVLEMQKVAPKSEDWHNHSYLMSLKPVVDLGGD